MSIDELIKKIDFKIGVLRMDADNCVTWHMSIMLSALQEIKTAAQEAKEQHKQDIINAVDGFPIHSRNLNGEDYYNETFNKQ
jgi:hypothetical protein